MFNRYLYARPLTSKEPREVALKLKQILDEARKKPQVISSDNGTEFGGIVAEFLQHRGIVQKFKNVGSERLRAPRSKHRPTEAKAR